MVKTLAEPGDWGQFEYRRMALLSRALREEGNEPESRIQWILATEAAGKNSQALLDLNRLATEWKWEGESIELLWVLARGPESAARDSVAEQGFDRKGRHPAVEGRGCADARGHAGESRRAQQPRLLLLSSEERPRTRPRAGHENYGEEPNNPG
jgi:hypothetical protein